MQTLTEIKILLATHGLHPKHRLGQNFLHDHNQLQRIVEAAQITPDDQVLEVGPGTGTLTEALLDAGARGAGGGDGRGPRPNPSATAGRGDGRRGNCG